MLTEESCWWQQTPKSSIRVYCCSNNTSFPKSLLLDGFTTSDSVLAAEYVGQSHVPLYRDMVLGPYDPHVVVSTRVSCIRKMDLSGYHLANPVSPQLATQAPPL